MGVRAPGHSRDVLSLPHPPTPPCADFCWRGLAFLHPTVNVQQKLSALYFLVSTNTTVTTVTLAVSQSVCPALHKLYLPSPRDNSLRQGVLPFHRREDRGTERFSNWAEAIYLADGGARK